MKRTVALSCSASGALALSLLLGACSSGADRETPDPAPGLTRLPTETPSAPTPVVTDAPSDGVVPDPGMIATDPPAVPPSPSDGTAAPVEVTFSYWGYDPDLAVAFANGYATTVDGSATCTLLLERQGREVASESVATPDAATTSCGEITVPGASLAPGTWSATLSFSSPASSGSSNTVEIVVP